MCTSTSGPVFPAFKSINTIHAFVENKPKKELILMLQKMGYDSDPVKAWKQAQEKVGQGFESLLKVLN